MSLQPPNLTLDLTKPFALIEKDGVVGAYQGKVFEIEALSDIHRLSKQEKTDIVFVLPYRAIREKGCDARGDEPILAMAVERSFHQRRDEFAAQLPDCIATLDGGITPSLSDEEYAALIARFQRDAIEKGLCSQTTLSRRFSGRIADFSLEAILGLYRSLLAQPGHYMTVLFAAVDSRNFSQSRYILAGTPERHLEISGNETIMVPIAGTCRKEDRETFPQRLRSWLQDPKEINELFQVLDEEMKMMGTICPKGGAIQGPFLREVGAVVHSEYRLVGRRSTHSIDALRKTLHAPTVVGSPLISAARLIAAYEPESRGYYAGEIGLYRQPLGDVPDGDIDCAILIRGAEISGTGQFDVRAGGGIVRDSDPASEAKESRAKAMGVMKILMGEAINTPYLTDALRRDVTPLLQSRNAALTAFWQADQGDGAGAAPPQAMLKGKTITIINNEDDFAHMLGHLLSSLGVETVILTDTFAYDPAVDASSDLVLLGPGPGDPMDMDHPRMQRLQDIIGALKTVGKPVLGICLGHQALAVSHGIPVLQQDSATQGMPRRVHVDGQDVCLGFYNSFSPVLPRGQSLPPCLEADFDEHNRIIALRGAGMVGYQFHPESVMSIDGRVLLLKALVALMPSAE